MEEKNATGRKNRILIKKAGTTAALSDKRQFSKHFY